MQLSASQSKYLRRLGHGLKPIVMIGADGASDAVLDELDRSLEHHELVKIRIRADDRATRSALLEHTLTSTRAALVQQIGHVALLYRPAEKPKVVLPAAHSH